MQLSTHYYVLTLGADKNTLFEAFRDFLITINNRGFPVMAPAPTHDEAGAVHANQLQEVARTVDECFDRHYTLDPLHLIVVGETEMRSAFSSVTAHDSAVIGCVDGDYSDTPARELGKIVWPVVKEAMSGVVDRTMQNLEACTAGGRTVAGLESVAGILNEEVRATLLVEDDYRVRGRIGGTDGSPVISTDLDVMEAMDDAVDAVIEKVLGSGGTVVFSPGGSLSDWNRIVLLLHGADET